MYGFLTENISALLLTEHGNRKISSDVHNFGRCLEGIRT
jgi:hypothetical protein